MKYKPLPRRQMADLIRPYWKQLSEAERVEVIYEARRIAIRINIGAKGLADYHLTKNPVPLLKALYRTQCSEQIATMWNVTLATALMTVILCLENPKYNAFD